MRLNLSFIKENFSSVSFLNLPDNLNLPVDISIDSRTVKEKQFYLALNGENFDGHNFVLDAVKNGTAGLIINESQINCLHSISKNDLSKIIIIRVSQTHNFLCRLASEWRKQFEFPIVGITGSVGKTTTKQMIHHILKTSQINSFTSYKNQNNLIGLPLNILKLTDEYEVAVFELGISQKGEMDQLVDILRPTICVITYISSAHVQGLGSLKNIAEEKFKIFKHLKNDEIAVLCGDQKILEKSFKHPVVKFGNNRSNHIHAGRIKFDSANNKISVSFDLYFYKQKRKVNLNVGHSGFVNNSLAAITVAHFLNIDFEKIIKGIESYSGFEQRFELQALKDKKGFLINDSYNACPQSMKVAIESFDQIKNSGDKIAILGDMLELGKKQSYWHRHIGRLLAKTKTIKNVILVGKQSRVIADLLPFAVNVKCVENWQDASKEYSKLIDQKNNLTLVKASHGIELDKLVKKVTD